MKIIDAKDFLDQLYTQGDVSDCRIRGNVVVKADVIRKKDVAAISLFNCFFEEIVVFADSRIEGTIIIEKCRFSNNVHFQNLTIESDRISPFNIAVKDCTFLGSVIFEHCKSNNTVLFEKSTISYLRTRALSINQGNFELEESTIKEGFYSASSIINGDFIIQRSRILKDLYLDDSKANNYLLLFSHFSEQILLLNGEGSKCLVSECNCNGVVQIENNQFQNIEMNGGVFKREVNVGNIEEENGKVVLRLTLMGGEFKNGFAFNGSKKPMIRIWVKCSSRLSGEFNFKDCTTHDVTLFGDNQNSYILFSRLHTFSLGFQRFINLGTLSFSELKSLGSTSSLFMKESNLGKTHFFNTDLSFFDNISIENSILREISTANVKWFKFQQLNPSESTHDINRDIFRQLKLAMEQQGDRIESLKFKGYEMQSYRKHLNSTPLNRINSWQDISDRLSILLNEWSNSNGQNWIKPIGLIVFFNFVAYLFLVFTVFNGTINDCTYLFRDRITSNFPAYIKLFDPISKFEDILNGATYVNNWIYTLLFAQRVMLAYLIFQAVAAFRKYLK